MAGTPCALLRSASKLAESLLQNQYFEGQVFSIVIALSKHDDIINDRLPLRGCDAHSQAESHRQAVQCAQPIAEDGSENYIRDGAVIEMEHINALLGKYAVELEIFKKYPFVFDASLQPPEDLAIAYNNRCFAYMKLGELNKALEDCTMSLRYGRLPDALQKQQELQRLMSARTT